MATFPWPEQMSLIVPYQGPSIYLPNGVDDEQWKSKPWYPFEIIVSVKTDRNAGLVGVTESFFHVDKEEQNLHGEAYEQSILFFDWLFVLLHVTCI